MNHSNTAGRTAFSQWQLTVLVIMAGMGGMYFYPENFGRWSLALLAAGIAIALISMSMLSRCYSCSASKSFPALLKERLGYLPAKIILAGTAVYFASEICCITVRQTHMTELFLLEKTPPQVILAVTLLTVCFIITSGIRQVARTAELLFPAIILPLVFIIAMALFCTDYGELLPLLRPNDLPDNIIGQSLMPLSGISATAYFAGYYSKSRLKRSLLGGSAVLSVFCLLILICCAGVFSIEGTRHLTFPLTELSRVVSIGRISLNHRFDILYIMIYNAVTVLTAGIMLYCCCISLCGVFSVKSHSCFCFLLLPVIYILSYLSLADDSIIQIISAYGKAVFLMGLVPVIFIAGSVQKYREAKAQA